MRELVGRALPGSVKPAITRIVTEYPGLTVKEIQERTGIKHSSVRATLWTLSQENTVARRDGRWFPVGRVADDEFASEN